MELSRVLFCVAANIHTQPFLLSNHHTLRGSIKNPDDILYHTGRLINGGRDETFSITKAAISIVIEGLKV